MQIAYRQAFSMIKMAAFNDENHNRKNSVKLFRIVCWEDKICVIWLQRKSEMMQLWN